jgi:splicing factor 3B subunit 3
VVKDRIFAADTHQSIHVLKLNKVDGQLYVVCDDMLQRYMTSMLVLDYNTIVGADKFDNVFVCRVPPEVREEQAAPSSLRLGPDTAYIMGKTQKLELVNQFHVGETITSLHKASLAPGASDVVLYSTLSGAIGVLYPFASKKEYNLFLSVESNMRQDTSLVGRDHAAFRGYYLPAKGVVDGDLIASFARMSLEERQTLSSVVGKSPTEIDKAVEEIKNRIT